MCIFMFVAAFVGASFGVIESLCNTFGFSKEVKAVVYFVEVITFIILLAKAI